MTRWFTSDLHLGHANIIGYCQRPFADVDEMDRILVERWNETVADGDEVWVIGDVAMGRLEQSLQLIAGLSGTKLLVPGNHDRCWPGRGERAREWVARYLDAGFADVLPEVVELGLGDRPVRACHFPYEGDSHDEDRFASHRPIDDGRPLLHGHVHTRWQVNGRQMNVGVDVWDYRPVADATIVEALRGQGDRAGVDHAGDQTEP
jgi:calcineurin-like phosphoesterase family protein